MLKYLVCFWFILLPCLVIAEEIDQLKKKEIAVLDRLIERSNKDGFSSQLYFRRATAYFELVSQEKNINSFTYKKNLKQALEDLQGIEVKDPKCSEIREVYKMQAQIFERMGQFDKAVENYQKFLSKTSSSKERAPILLRMTYLYSERNEFSKMSEILKMIKLKENDPLYLSWLKQNIFVFRKLNQLENALDSVQNGFEVILSDKKQEAENQSELAFFINELGEVSAPLYLSGKSEYQASILLSRFREIAQNDAVYERIVKKFNQILRVQGNSKKYVYWIQSALTTPMSLEMKASIYFEYFDYLVQFIHLKDERIVFLEALDEITKIAQQIATKNPETSNKIKDKLTSIQQTLVTKVKKEKDKGYQGNYRLVLSAVYENLGKFSHALDDKKLMSIFNLAENDFALKKFFQAYQGYMQVKLEGKKANLPNALIKESHLKAVASFYEHYKVEHPIVNKELKPQKIVNDEPLSSELKTWLALIDEYSETYSKEEKIKDFFYESARIVYLQKNYSAALQRLNKVVQTDGFKESYKISAVALILDSLQKSERWSEVYSLCDTWLKNGKKYQIHTQERQFIEVGALAFLKKMEHSYQEQQYEQILSETNVFLKSYPASKQHVEVSKIAGNAALKLGKKEGAVSFYNYAAQKSDSTELKNKVVQLNASEFEKKFETREALESYLQFIQSLSEKNIQTNTDTASLNVVFSKALHYAWLTKSTQKLAILLNHPLCKKFNSECSTFQFNYDVLSFHEEPQKLKNDRIQLGLSHKERYKKQVYQIIGLIKRNESKNFLDRKQKLSDFSKIKNLIPLEVLSIIYPDVKKYAENYLVEYQTDLYKNAPISLQPQAIQKRSNALAELESTYQAIEAIFNPEQKVKLNYYLAQEYRKTVQELNEATPKNLSPEEKVKIKDVISQLTHPLSEREKGLLKKSMELVAFFGVKEEFERVSYQMNINQAGSRLGMSFSGNELEATLKIKESLEQLQLSQKSEDVYYWKRALSRSLTLEQWPLYLTLVQNAIDLKWLNQKDQKYFLGLMNIQLREFGQAYAYLQDFIKEFQMNSIQKIEAHSLTAFLFERSLKVESNDHLKEQVAFYQNYLERQSEQDFNILEKNAALILLGFYESKSELDSKFETKIFNNISSSSIKKMLTDKNHKRIPANLDDLEDER